MCSVWILVWNCKVPYETVIVKYGVCGISLWICLGTYPLSPITFHLYESHPSS